jgi:hypothetical protein
MTDTSDIVYRLRKRAEIRRSIVTRKSVQEGQPDRIALLLDEAADEITRLRATVVESWHILIDDWDDDLVYARAKSLKNEDKAEYEAEIARDKFDGIELLRGLILCMTLWSDERVTFETIPRRAEDIQRSESQAEQLCALLDQIRDDEE